MKRPFLFLPALAFALSLALALARPVCAEPDKPALDAEQVPQKEAKGQEEHRASRLFELLRSTAYSEARAFVRADEDAAREAESKKRAEEVQRQKEAEEQAQKEALKREAEAKKKEAEELSRDDEWKNIWESQRASIETTIADASRLTRNFQHDTDVAKQIHPVIEDIRRLTVIANNFKEWASPLEGLSRQLSIRSDLVRSLVAQASTSEKNARSLLERLNKSAETMPALATNSKEVREYIRNFNKARFLLTAVITRYESALAPARSFIKQIDGTRKEIEGRLPVLWKKLYMSGPVPWLSGDYWAKIPRILGYLGQSFSLRRPVELPSTNAQWQTCIVRFIVAMGFLSILGTMLAAKLLGSAPLKEHILRWSMPWNVVGLSLLTCSITPTGETYRLLLALGNLSLIMGQIFLAWDLRRMKFPEVTSEQSPFWNLVPLTMCAYIFLYLPLPRLFLLLGWLVCLTANILARRRFRHAVSLGGMQIENAVLDLEPIVLWICLLVVLCGFHVFSMLLYLMYTSISIAVQLFAGSMYFISDLNDRLPKEGAKAVMASLLIALSAPCVIVLAVIAVGLWLGTLPGGIYILQNSIFKDVSIGDTRLNFIQMLLIITVFFLARTASRMGNSFIQGMPARGMKVDASLITPMQTGFTYLVWALFGLFVLHAIGLNMSSLAVVAGGLSVGIGFGMQNIVNNFVSGLILIFSRTLQVGDVVEVAGVVGRIRQITVRATVVQTYSGATIYVPNSEFISGRLTNWTSDSRSRRVDLSVGVAYGADTERATKLLLDAAQADPDILAFPKPIVLFREFGDSTLDFKLRYWIKDFEDNDRVNSRLHFAINESFAKDNIEIAFPQMDLHVKDMPARSAAGHASARTPVQSQKSRPRPRSLAGARRAKPRRPQPA